MRKFFGIIAAASFFMLIGVVGGMERGTIEMIPGMVRMAVYVSLFALSAAVMNGRKRVARRHVYRVH